jgi:cytoskeletal protein RodZ
MEEWAYDSEERRILRRELEERRCAKEARKERGHQELKRLHWFAALVSLIGAAASWVAVWVQWDRSPPPAAPANPLAAISPVPTPQESPAVTSPAPTPEELAPTLEESVPPPEESAPTLEQSVPLPEESAPTLEEPVPPPEESVPTLEEPPVTSPVPSPAEPSSALNAPPRARVRGRNTASSKQWRFCEHCLV